MNITAATGKLEIAKADALLIGLFEGEWNKAYDKIDAKLGRSLKKSIDNKKFTGELYSLKGFTTLGNLPYEQVLVLGLGKEADLDPEKFKCAMGVAMRALKKASMTTVVTDLQTIIVNDHSLTQMAHLLTEASLLALYDYDKYKSNEKPKKEIKSLTFVDDDNKAVPLMKKGIEQAKKLCVAVNWARDLVNRPPSDKNSLWMADQAKALARKYKLKIKVFDKPALKKMGCNAILAVNRGSAFDARMVVLEYKKGKGKPTVLVGKGITFDSGGLGIKPAKSMEDMKIDMGGSAAVLGTLRAIAELNLPVNVTGVIGLTDNMLGANAYKPGDIIKAYNGKTIEILHTDAEGRVVLADCLSYAAKHLGPQRIIDLATLTGACVVALGNSAIGLMGNDDELIQDLAEAGSRSTDKAWPLPLYDDYKEMVKSKIADVKNIGARGKAGACSAGAFLSNFIGDNTWAHLDIAGPAYLDEDKKYLTNGATGAGVRLLVEYLKKL